MGELSAKRRIDVMVSSTTSDLGAYRQRLSPIITNLRLTPRMMDNDSATGKNSLTYSLDLVDEAEIYILLLGFRYGYIPADAERNPDGLSMTHLEYRRAKKRQESENICVYAFLLDDSLKPEVVRPELTAFRNEVLKDQVKFFKTEDELVVLVMQALAQSKCIQNNTIDITARRFEAAMPSQTQVGQDTEVWVKISLPSSDGLKGELPAEVASGDIIEVEDAKATNMRMNFEEDGTDLHGKLCLQLTSKQFDVISDEVQGDCIDGQVEIEVQPDSDTETIVFDLEPKDPEYLGRARVRVTASQHDKVIARISLATDVVREIEKIPKWMMKVLSAGGAELLKPDDIQRLIQATIQSAFARSGLESSSDSGEDIREIRDKYSPRRDSDDGWGDDTRYRDTAWADVIRPILASLRESLPLGNRTLLDEYTSEAWQLVWTLYHPQLEVKSRNAIGERLSEIGDPRKGVGIDNNGLPDIDWVTIPAGEFQYGDDSSWSAEPQVIDLPEYQISRYPVTYQQYQTFLDALDGVSDDRWWVGMPEDTGREYGQFFEYNNHPRENVSWYQAVAFCRWLSNNLGYEVRLPTEFEWEKAARGNTGWLYPYGNDYDPDKGNTWETGIHKTSAVGIFPNGASPYGVMDMSGNVWEWCLNQYDAPYESTVDSTNVRRVLRGGGWLSSNLYARAVYRYYSQPSYRPNYYGFRLCVPLLG